MITVIRRPLGHKLSDTILTGTASDSGGDVIITTPVNHGLSDGDYVYIDSNFESYNGFKYVDSVSYTTFKIKDSEDGDYSPFKQTASINYQVSLLNHGWQSVHLPIVYELESDLYPTNVDEEAYTPITVASFENNNGYVQLNLSSALTDPTALSKIKLVGSGDLAGVYQITNVIHPWSVVIDLAYDATFSFSGYQIVRYFDNYSINVNIYAGLTAGHRWEEEKEVVLAATKKFVPDSDNKVLFSIDEILRGYIETVNNLAKDTLPNNIDFMVEFYIGYYESYDMVSSGEIILYEGDEDIDDFIGNAVNSKNEFKNVNSGFMSDYISDSVTPGAWLTDFERPQAIVGYFFDLSFINRFNDVDIEVTILKKLAGDLQSTEVLTFEDPGNGILRVPITAEDGYDEYCITAATNLTDLAQDLEDWVMIAGSDVNWTGIGTSSPQVYLGSSGAMGSNRIKSNLALSTGETYRVFYTITCDQIFWKMRLRFRVSGSATTPLPADITGTSGVNTGYIDVTVDADTDDVTLEVFKTTGGPLLFEVNELQIYLGTPESIDQEVLTEEICIDILSECDNTLTDDLRELETGDFRLLE